MRTRSGARAADAAAGRSGVFCAALPAGMILFVTRLPVGREIKATHTNAHTVARSCGSKSTSRRPRRGVERAHTDTQNPRKKKGDLPPTQHAHHPGMGGSDDHRHGKHASSSSSHHRHRHHHSSSSRHEGETEEERHARRAAKKAAKREREEAAAAAAGVGGYSNEANPWNDPNLGQAFVWKRKEEKAAAAAGGSSGGGRGGASGGAAAMHRPRRRCASGGRSSWRSWRR